MYQVNEYDLYTINHQEYDEYDTRHQVYDEYGDQGEEYAQVQDENGSTPNAYDNTRQVLPIEEELEFTCQFLVL